LSELADLYQEIILEHYKKPRNFGPLPGANRNAEGFNPLCGDRVHLHLEVEGGRIAAVRFEGGGCAISTASASLLTEALKGKTEAEAERLFHDFHDMLTGDPARTAELEEALGKLAALSGVREYPMRVKCATLAWHTLHAALQEQDATVTTE
jgi:nitrogen fixation protein NifU and related proteins